MIEYNPSDFVAYHTDGDGNEWAKRPMIVPRGPSVLIVGPDGVGKTSIAGRLSEMTLVPTFKFPAEHEVFRMGQRSQLLFDLGLAHFLAQTGYRFISDRAYPCEWVYARVFGRETDQTLLSMIDDIHRDIKTKILYLYSSVQPVEPDELVPTERYWDVKRGYDEFCDWTDCEVWKYDTSRTMHMTALSARRSRRGRAWSCWACDEVKVQWRSKT